MTEAAEELYQAVYSTVPGGGARGGMLIANEQQTMRMYVQVAEMLSQPPMASLPLSWRAKVLSECGGGAGLEGNLLALFDEFVAMTKVNALILSINAAPLASCPQTSSRALQLLGKTMRDMATEGSPQVAAGVGGGGLSLVVVKPDCATGLLDGAASCLRVAMRLNRADVSLVVELAKLLQLRAAAAAAVAAMASPAAENGQSLVMLSFLGQWSFAGLLLVTPHTFASGQLPVVFRCQSLVTPWRIPRFLSFFRSYMGSVKASVSE